MIGPLLALCLAAQFPCKAAEYPGNGNVFWRRKVTDIPNTNYVMKACTCKHRKPCGAKRMVETRDA